MKKHWYDYLWIASLLYLLLGFFNILFAYIHITAAGLRMKDSVMETVTAVQENAADIVASAKDINEARASKEAETQVEGQEA